MTGTPPPRRRPPVVSTIVGYSRHSLRDDATKLSVTFSYRQDDPHSVVMDISDIDDTMPGDPRLVGSKQWECARSLFSDALTGRRLPTQMGDVLVSVYDPDTARIRLMDPKSCLDHPVTFDMFLDLYLVRQFLKRTFADVPAGDETLFVDVDSALATLFGDDRHRSGGA